MKLRTITTIMALLAVGILICGWYLYYISENKSAYTEVKQLGEWHAHQVASLFQNSISSNAKAVESLVSYPEIKNLLSGRRSAEKLAAVNNVLDSFKTSFAAQECYLIDLEGTTIASTNRNAPDSFVGQNYAFRPYFKQAINGTPSLYLAMGATSGKRGIYLSHPVISNSGKSPSGVAVIKFPVTPIEKEILSAHLDHSEMISMVVDPNGVIFMSDHPAYVLQLLKKPPKADTTLNQEQKSQFGKNLMKWSGFQIQNKHQIHHRSGEIYIFSKRDLVRPKGWQVFHLHNTKMVQTLVKERFSSIFGWISLSSLVFMMLVAYLFAQARKEIRCREDAESSLEENKNFLKTLLEAIPIPVFYKDRQGRYTGFNKAFEYFFGKNEQDLVGKSVFDINPEELAKIYHQKDEELFLSGGVQHYESEVQNAFEDRRNVIFDKSVFRNAHSEFAGLIGTVLDITEQKKAEKDREELIEKLQTALAEIKTLQGIIPICARCKKIRDDKGYWNQIESYIKAHSEAEFSHGLCPECSEALYGKEEWFTKIKK